MKPYVIGDEAERELIDALVYHSEHWGDSGRDRHAELLAAFDRISRSPNTFPVAGYGNRMLILRDLQFVIYYFDQPPGRHCITPASNSAAWQEIEHERRSTHCAGERYARVGLRLISKV